MLEGLETILEMQCARLVPVTQDRSYAKCLVLVPRCFCAGFCAGDRSKSSAKTS